MRFADRIARHRRSLLAVLGIAIAAGVMAGLGLPVSLFPNIAFPRIAVTIEAGDRPIGQMAAVITRPLEQAVRAVPDVTSVRSVTSRGAADLKVSFAWHSDLNLALQRTESALARTAATLPPGVTFSVRRMDPTVFPVAAYSLTSDRAGPVAITRYAQLTLIPLLTAIPGVARVDAFGGDQGEYRVETDPTRLRALGLTLADVTASLGAANVLSAAGKLEDRGKLLLTLADSHLGSVTDVENVVIKSSGGSMVRLGDIAGVRLAGAPRWLRVTANGRPAVSLQVYQQPSGDTPRIVRDVARVFAAAHAGAPPALRISPWYDQSELIDRSAQALAEAIAIGAVLAALVLLVFLRNLRITLATVVVVPVVLAVTTLALGILGQSFNIMTLGGMAAAIGLIIDDAIVMIEHIERRLSETSADRLGAMRAAASEFFRPLLGSSAATILIFLPLAFLTGVTGEFFRALSLTMAIALSVSFMVTWLIVPILMESFFRTARAKAPARDIGVVRRYRRALTHMTRTPWLAVAIMIPMAVVGLWAFTSLPSGFIPKLDEGGFILDYIAPSGASISETDRLVRQIETVLSATPEVVTYSRRTGAQLGGDLTESNVGDIFVRLKALPRRPIAAVMEEVRGKVEARIPGISIETAQLIEDEIGDLTAVPQPIEIKLYGEDEAQVRDTAARVAKRLADIRGIAELKNGTVIAGDALDVKIDLARAAIEGISPTEASKQITALLSGEVATQIQTGPLLSNVRVWIPPGQRDRVSAVEGFPLRASDGHILSLSRIATVDTLTGQTEIQRENGRLVVPVTGRVVGRDLGSAANEARDVLTHEALLPAGVTFEMGGLYAEQQSAFRGLASVFLASLAIIMVLLLLIYENVRIVVVIIAMPLMAAFAVALGLRLAGVELNIMALMGLTMVIGIVTEVAIFYFTEYDTLVAEGADPADALIDAGANRLRPIAMTTLAAILALTPLALGSSMQQPLAVAIIAGLIAQGPLILLVMPALFRLIGGVKDSTVAAA